MESDTHTLWVPEGLWELIKNTIERGLPNATVVEFPESLQTDKGVTAHFLSVKVMPNGK